ncbi:MAG: hypothetical protein ACFCGT_08525 [Sandaracinaceae bacterium]
MARGRHWPLRTAGVLAAAVGLLMGTASPAPAQDPSDPFAPLRRLTGNPVTVPPRALAVIPERHAGRHLRVIDVLESVDPQFDDLARGFGLSHELAIQLRLREAHIPIFVAKTEASISTVLQLRLGSTVEVRGVLIARGGRYLFLASEVRPSNGAGRGRRGR